MTDLRELLSSLREDQLKKLANAVGVEAELQDRSKIVEAILKVGVTEEDIRRILGVPSRGPTDPFSEIIARLDRIERVLRELAAEVAMLRRVLESSSGPLRPPFPPHEPPPPFKPWGPERFHSDRLGEV